MKIATRKKLRLGQVPFTFIISRLERLANKLLAIAYS